MNIRSVKNTRSPTQTNKMLYNSWNEIPPFWIFAYDLSVNHYGDEPLDDMYLQSIIQDPEFHKDPVFPFFGQVLIGVKYTTDCAKHSSHCIFREKTIRRIVEDQSCEERRNLERNALNSLHYRKNHGCVGDLTHIGYARLLFRLNPKDIKSLES